MSPSDSSPSRRAGSRSDGGTPSDDPERLRETGDRETGDEKSPVSDGGIDGADLLEQAVVVASVLIVVALFGYVAWQATVTTAGGVPTATVEAVEPMPGPDDDRLRVTARLDNRRGTGLASVGVVVRCGGTERSLSFEHVPAGGRRAGTVLCPAETEPAAAVVTWTEA